ncbi:MAG: PfkB family carbohydrate kinase [Planctomycetota bacterium]
MRLLVTGSIGIDTVVTPHGRAENVLGGSSIYFSFAASQYGPVRLVGVVGEDFPREFREVLLTRPIDLRGLEVRSGSRTFRWHGRFVGDMNQAETVDVQLNVLAEKGPRVPESFADSEAVFLANTHPTLQRELLAQLRAPKLIVCDTMNLWIENERESLIETLRRVTGLIINDAEIRQFTGKSNLIDAGREVCRMGPQFLIIKKGEHGAMLVTGENVTTIPAYPTTEVRDPTGAGDSFAGGVMGFLCSEDRFDTATLRRAMVHGTIGASFVIEGFSLERVRVITRRDIDQRVERFLDMLRV